MSVSFSLLGILVIFLSIKLADYLAKRTIHRREFKKGFREHSTEREKLADILEDIIKTLDNPDVIQALANAYRLGDKKPFTSVISAFRKRLDGFASTLVGKDGFQKIIEGLPTGKLDTYVLEMFNIALSVCDASLSRLIRTHEGRSFYSGSDAICFLASCSRFDEKYSACLYQEDDSKYGTHDTGTLSKNVESHINLVNTVNVYSRNVVDSTMGLLTEIAEKDELLGKYYDPIYDRIEAVFCTIDQLPSIELGDSQDEDVRRNARLQAREVHDWVMTLIDKVMIIYASAVLAETSTEIERKLNCLHEGKTAFRRR